MNEYTERKPTVKATQWDGTAHSILTIAAEHDLRITLDIRPDGIKDATVHGRSADFYGVMGSATMKTGDYLVQRGREISVYPAELFKRTFQQV